MFHGQCTEEQMKIFGTKRRILSGEFCKEDKDSFHLVKGAEAYFDALKDNIPLRLLASIKQNIDFVESFFIFDRWLDPSSIVYDDGTYENKIAMFKSSRCYWGRYS